MKRRERVSSFLIVEAGLILLNILCYGDIRWLLLEQILLFPCFNVLKRKKREKEKHLYEKGFQNLLQSMMTSLQAGYSLNNSCRIALKELEELYQDQNNPMLRQMSNGVSQREACQDWGMQFRTDSYQKLSLILIQSFTKGGREAAMLMEAEEREAFHKRIDRAKKEGEEASTRLLFPMILLLCQVMLLVMYPALTRFQGF